MLDRAKFPTAQFVLIVFASLSVAFYLLKPTYTSLHLLILSVSVTIVVVAIMFGGYRLRMQLTVKRLLKKNIIGDDATQILNNKRRDMIQSYYGSLCGVILLSIIVHFFHLGAFNELPLWQSIVVYIIAFGLPDLAISLFNGVTKRKRAGN